MKKQSLLLAVVASLVLASAPARAELNNLTPEEKETAYQILCVPGSDSSRKTEEVNEAKKLRTFFHGFLVDPQPVVTELEKSGLFDKDAKNQGWNLIGAAIMFGVTCGIVDSLQSEITLRGCVNEQGAKASITSALAACKPLLEKAKASQNK